MQYQMRQLMFAGLLAVYPAVGADINVGAVDLNNLNRADLYTNGLNNNGTEATLASFASQTWTVSIKNTSDVNWVDFEVLVPAASDNGSGVVFGSAPTVTGGFGGTAQRPAMFSLSMNNHMGTIIAANAGQQVAPGSTITLTMPVDSGSSMERTYHINVQATVPEPGPMLTCGLAVLALAAGVYRRRNA